MPVEHGAWSVISPLRIHLSSKVRETRSTSSQKRSERGWEVLAARVRFELGIHGLNRWLVKC